MPVRNRCNGWGCPCLHVGPWPGPEGPRNKRAVRSWSPLGSGTFSWEPDLDMVLVGAMTLLKRAVRSWSPLGTGTCRA